MVDENGYDGIGDADASEAYVVQLARLSFRPHTKPNWDVLAVKLIVLIL